MIETVVKCPLCHFDSCFAKKVEQHLIKVHEKDPEELYVSLYLGGVKPLCGCGCGTPLKWFGWKNNYHKKYIVGHNARVYTAFNDPGVQEKIHIKVKEGYDSGRLVPPTKGKTKENDKTLKKISDTLKRRYDNGEIKAIHPIQKGDSKESNETCRKISEKLKQGYAEGRLVWDNPIKKGDAKETNHSAMKTSLALKKKFEEGTWSPPMVKGDTRETNDVAKKISETKKQQFVDGVGIFPRAIQKGDTKETNLVLRKISESLKASYASGKITIANNRTLDTNEVKKRINEVLGDNFEILFDFSGYKSETQKLDLKCNKCGTIQWKSLQMIVKTPVCFACYPKGSKGQVEIYEFLKSHFAEVEFCNRQVIKPKELDIIVPSKNFAIEFNGLFYHSEVCLRDPKDYHFDKTLACKAANYQLFHVFEDQWNQKRDIVESMILVRLGLAKRNIAARKCQIVSLTPQEREDFFELNHLDGDVRSEVSWGLINNGEIVAAIALRKPFHRSAYPDSYEISRFACALHTVSPGALGKLLSVAKEWLKTKDCKKLITYVDLEHGDGIGYQKVGFNFVHQTKCKFWWTDFVDRYNRFYVKADKENGLTEEQVAAKKGVFKIYGCPNNLYEMILV